MKKIFLIVIVLLGIFSKSYAEEIVFEGVPLVKGVSTFEESYNSILQGEDKTRFKLIITKVGDKFIWFSREKKELEFIDSNSMFLLFLSRNGDFIKISREKTDTGYLYIEHLSDGFRAITYWGQSNDISGVK